MNKGKGFDDTFGVVGHSLDLMIKAERIPGGVNYGFLLFRGGVCKDAGS